MSVHVTKSVTLNPEVGITRPSETEAAEIPDRSDGRWVRRSDYGSLKEAMAAARAAALEGIPAHGVANIDAKAVRARTGLTQDEFARRFGLSPDALQNWEAGRRTPDAAARVLLAVIAHNQQAVVDALAAAAGAPYAPLAPAKQGRPGKAVPA